MSDPRISVVVPNYNHGHYLARCLRALLDQPVLPYEILVIDDASTDNSVAVVAEFVRQHPLVRLLQNARNLGVNGTLQRGLEETQGEFIGFFAADDEVKPGIFAHAMRLLRDHPEAGLCTGVSEFRDTAGLQWYLGRKMPSQPCFLSPDALMPLARADRLSLCSCNALYSRRGLREVGGWDARLTTTSDWFLMHLLAFRYGVCHIPDAISIMYIYPGSYSHTHGRFAAECRKADYMLDFLLTPEFADVIGRFRRSGVLGELGWPGLRQALRRRSRWGYINAAFLRHVARRCAEHFGRRLMPTWLSSLCVRILYHGRGGCAHPDADLASVRR